MRGRGAPKGGGVLPPKPKGWDDAKARLDEAVNGRGHVGWGFAAAPGAEKPGEGSWTLYVYSNDADLKVPAEVSGIPVAKRAVPVASPAWPTGRRAR